MNEQKRDPIEYGYSDEKPYVDDESLEDILSDDKSSYLDDDEAFLAGDDAILSEKEALRIFQQSDNLVSYEILNLYDDKGKIRNRISLLNEPPILHISSSKQESVDFLLTKNFTKNLANMLKDIDRAYVGISPKKEGKPWNQEGIRQRFDSVIEWIRENKVKALLLALLAVLFIIYSVISFS